MLSFVSTESGATERTQYLPAGVQVGATIDITAVTVAMFVPVSVVFRARVGDPLNADAGFLRRSARPNNVYRLAYLEGMLMWHARWRVVFPNASTRGCFSASENPHRVNGK